MKMLSQNITLFLGLVKFRTNVRKIHGCKFFTDFDVVKVLHNMLQATVEKSLANYLEVNYLVKGGASKVAQETYLGKDSNRLVQLENYALITHDDEVSILIDRKIISDYLRVSGLFNLKRAKNNEKFVLDVLVNSLYHRFIRLQIGGITPVGAHISNLIYLLGLKNDVLFVHGSSVLLDDTVFTFVAPPDTGKTALAFKMSEALGAKLLAEDITCFVIKNGKIIVVPSMYTTTYLKSPPIMNATKLGLRVKLDYHIGHLPLIPFFIRASNYAREASKVLNKHNLCGNEVTPAQVKLIFLEQGPVTKIEAFPLKNSTENLAFQNRAEFNYLSDKVIILLSQWDESFEPSYMLNIEQGLFKQLVSGAHSYRAKINYNSYSELISKLVNKD
jgi:hypothetical protein